jgi:hypothetical protein
LLVKIDTNGHLDLNPGPSPGASAPKGNEVIKLSEAGGAGECLSDSLNIPAVGW